MTKHTHGLSVTHIAGEGIDADYVEQPREFCDPSYPICQGCDEESDDDRGWCSRCEMFADDVPPVMPLPPVRGTVRQIMDRIALVEVEHLGPGRIAA